MYEYANDQLADLDQLRSRLAKMSDDHLSSTHLEDTMSRCESCSWRIRPHAAIGVWYKPRQCFCQR
jgi:hypothetical protein